jgi:hypothetical protein
MNRFWFIDDRSAIRVSTEERTLGETTMNKERRMVIAGVSILLLGRAPALANETMPHRIYVPDSETATIIAEAVLIPIYGRRKIEGERPFHAELRGDVWVVSGSLPQGYLGGVATVEINRVDGRIINAYHTK